MGAEPGLLRVAISPRRDSFLRAMVRGGKQPVAVQEDQATIEGTKEVHRGSSTSAQGRLHRLPGEGLMCWVLKAE